MQPNATWPTRGAMSLLFAISSGLAFAGPPATNVDVSFNIISPITLNEPAYIGVAITNRERYPVTFDIGPLGNHAFHFTLVTPEGKTVPHPSHEGIESLARINLKPKGEYSQRILLNAWGYQFDIPGEYRISIITDLCFIRDKHPNPRAIILGAHETAHQTDEVVLKVFPRNEIVLKERCDALLRRFQNTPEFALERLDIAEELSYITDPIAIPYLAKLIPSREVASALEGLTRIGTDEAAEAMIPATQNNERSGYAKALLRQKLLPKILDENIREKIEAAVK